MSIKLRVVIKESEWLRGEGSGPSALYRSRDGKRCCIGFVCNALGLRDEDIEDTSSIEKLDERGDLDRQTITRLVELNLSRSRDDVYVSGHTPQVAVMYGTNDNVQMDDSERKALLTKQGADVGIEFVFVP